MPVATNILKPITIMALLGLALSGCQDPKLASNPLEPGQVTPKSLPIKLVKGRITSQQKAAKLLKQDNGKHILFGDTHVHTTYSPDAFKMSLPIMHGSDGAFPPAAACDYARFVSQLDFYFLTDHAESYTPKVWADQVASIRQCAQMTDLENPDVIPFIGWEWTQVGVSADNHYGHHNVLFKDIDEGLIPSRPIAAAGAATTALRSKRATISKIMYALDPVNMHYYQALNDFNGQMRETPVCQAGIKSNELPTDCFETAAHPGELYDKLDDWGFDTLVIPHGTTWGIYTPPNSSWQHQLQAKYHDPDKNRLIEVYSGHGNSEPYRDWQYNQVNEDGVVSCPEPTDNYLPSCWQAGEIIKERCLAAKLTAQTCEQRSTLARQYYAQNDTVAAWLSVPGTQATDWLDSGQARDIDLASFNYRPKKSVQYGLALRNFDDPEQPIGYQWGMLASSDTHTARAGHGFKQTGRAQNTESTGIKSAWLKKLLAKDKGDATSSEPELLPDINGLLDKYGFNIMEFERRESFFTLGGLAAVHSEKRDRDGIWQGLKRREVYATTGQRTLLWFDLINGSHGNYPMGSHLTQQHNPKFKISAQGSFEQLPGCPEGVFNSLSPERLEKLAQGECYHPSDIRRRLTHMEVVRIRPQQHAQEAVTNLIDDPWLRFECPDNSSTCQVEFEDTDFSNGQRDSLYYVRVFEAPLPMVNGSNLRTQFNDRGQAQAVNPCYGDYRVDRSDDCLAEVAPRAWSSPIFVDY